MAMGAIVLDLRPGLRIGLFSLGMPICEAFAQIEQQPNIYDVVHVKYFDETLVCGQHSVVIISSTILHVVWTSYLMDRLIRSRSLFCIKLSRSCRFQFI